jgi:cobalamin biosynthetic protein CobC
MNGFTYHGGRLADAKAHFGNADTPWIDLSTGINPHGWPGAGDLSIDWHALPDVRALEELEAAAAAYLATDRAHVCAVPGTEIGLRLLGDILPGPAAYAESSYRTYGEIFRQGRPVRSADVAAVDDATVILANPNNPDGRLMPPASLLGQLERLRESSHWLVIDEAFADANPGISLADRVNDARPLVIFRSFGKFFGLAGVRLGFVLGPRSLIARYREKLGSWPVSAAALAIGSAAYRDMGWIASMRRTLYEDAGALDAVLAKRGFEAVGACPLFRLIETDDATALFERLARRAILTRPFDYNPRWLRIGLPADREGLARLDEALRDD